MEDLHFILHLILFIIWIYIGYLLLKNKKRIPINLFGLMLVSVVMIIYIIGTDIVFESYWTHVEGTRWEWYIADILISIIYIKVINISSKMNKVFNCMSKVKTK